MLELRNRDDFMWDENLRPLDAGPFCKEPFHDWWGRHETKLKHIHPEIAQQWIYRHWREAHFKFLRLEVLSWRSELWSTDQILSTVHLEWGAPMDPQHDYQTFTENEGSGPMATARGWRDGSWDVPLVVLSTPVGVRTYTGELPEVRFIVVEGSKRMRFLNALAYRKIRTGPHKIYVLESPDACASI